VTDSEIAAFGAADRSAREALARSDADIARLLVPKTGVAFVGRVDLSDAARFQFARYGDVKIYFVNPNGGAGDIPVVRSVLDLPDDIDLVVIRVAPARVPQIVEDCGQRGIRDVLVFSDGFSETGPEGARLERELAAAAARAGVRVIGPNTNDNTFERYPRPANHRGGAIALITQSGANGRSLVEGVAMGACFHRWVTVGNEADLEASDFIHHFAGLPEVATIALYVEGFRSTAKLRAALERALLAGKPVVAIKMGSTARGARSAASHTGHLTGADAVVQGLFRRYGVTRVRELDELLETANLFAKLPRDTGTRCAMYTISGGTAALMAEAADAAGLQVPEFSGSLQAGLHRHIPQNLSVANPVDNGGGFLGRADQAERLQVLDLIASPENVDVVVAGLNAAYGRLSDAMAADLLAWSPAARKPAVGVWPSVVIDTRGYADLVASGVPIFRSFGKCMRALRAHADFAARRARFEPDAPVEATLSADQRRALSRAGVLGAGDAETLLSAAGIALARSRLAPDAAAAADAAREIGLPVAIKVMSPDIPHKSELGLVRLGVETPEAARATAEDLLARARAAGAARIDGVLVQEQVEGGVEMIVGLSQDPQFGPTLTLGAGGVHAEVLKDVVASPLPVGPQDVRDMIASLRMAPLLDGVRGAPPADKAALVDLVLRAAALGLAAGDRIQEMDLNPVLVQPHRAVVVDALVVAGPPPPGG
jgi:acyl-CoA synthetase (NDP forming)